MRAMDGRAFARTTSGYVGIVPFNARPGDTIAVFLGSQVPIILRQHPSRGGVYLVIGECYVHGILNGEALNGVAVSTKILLA